MTKPRSQPLDLLAPDLPNLAEHDYSKKPLVSYHPNFIPDHAELFESLMADIQSLDNIVRIDDDFGNRRTTGNLWRRSPMLEPRAISRRLTSPQDGGIKRLERMTPTTAMLAGRFWGAAGQMPDDVQLCLYRDGRDHVAPHADDAMVVGPSLENQVIGIFSFGTSRKLSFFHMDTYRTDSEGRPATKPEHELELEAGSLVVMYGKTQWHWLHSILPSRTTRPRISVSCIYYQDLRAMRDAPYKLMERPRRKGYCDSVPYLIHRHVGTPEECVARWNEIRAEEGIAPNEIDSALRGFLQDFSDERLQKPQRSDFGEEISDYYTAIEEYGEKAKAIAEEGIQEALKTLKTGPRLMLVSPSGKQISYSKAQGRWGTPEDEEGTARPAGVDPHVWKAVKDIRDIL